MKRDLSSTARAAMSAAGQKGAARRWANRGPSATIRVDRDIAVAIKQFGSNGRAIASNAIRAALG